jgi:hypothetical protein
MNRGVSVTVQLLDPTTRQRDSGSESMQEMRLPVAMHSPLVVFKDRLNTVTGIPPEAQVLILLDLSDPDRNNDKHLDDAHDLITLRDIGIVDGSILSLHALGIGAERAQLLMKESAIAKRHNEELQEIARKGSTVLQTKVSAKEADHSFNGIIFDVVSRDAHEVEIMSISLAGMLGRVRIFAKPSSWQENMPEHSNSYWGHHPGVCLDGWELVADQNCYPSWDRPLEINFKKPWSMLPHSKHAFYCHSGLPEDLGIQYTSCGRKEITAFDDHVAILPGLGHCGSKPFDNENGWYRHPRTLTGSLRYQSKLKGWNPRQHGIFPKVLRDAVWTMICAQHHDTLRDIPIRPQLLKRSYSTGDSNERTTTKDDMDIVSDITKPKLMRSASAPIESTGTSSSVTEMTSSNAPDAVDVELNALGPPLEEHENFDNMKCSADDENNGSSEHTSSNLSMLNDKHIVYHICEFMHWDWFKNIEDKKQVEDIFNEEDENESMMATRRRSTMQRLLGAFMSNINGNGMENGDEPDEDGQHLLQQLQNGGFEFVFNNLMSGANGGEDDDDDSYYQEEDSNDSDEDYEEYAQVEELDDEDSDEDDKSGFLSAQDDDDDDDDDDEIEQEEEDVHFGIGESDEEEEGSEEEIFMDASDGNEEHMPPSPATQARILDSIASRIPNSFTVRDEQTQGDKEGEKDD